MREIKFRAWDGEQMSHYELNIDSAGFLTQPPNPADNKPFKILMQFTGLKDNNDKEIYEGDIVRNIHGWFAEIRWKTLGWALFDHSFFHTSIKDVTQAEVIGNIYENPELLSS